MKQGFCAFVFSILAAVALAELPVETVPKVEALPAKYPDSWIFAHDFNFNTLIAGKIILVDTAAETREYKGAIDATQFASFVASSKNNSELYVGDTFYSRSTSGVRTDVISIYDKATLNKTGEILLPKNNRAQIVASKYLLRLIDRDRFLLVFNFTPAASVTVIDTRKRMITAEISLPGCSLIYPTGKRGFSSLCGDGSFFTVQLNRKGEPTRRSSSASFFSVDEDPVFDKPVYIGMTAYFVSFKSKVYEVNMSGNEPEVKGSWSLVNEAQASQNWRPSGWQIATGDDDELVYVVMSENGYDGSHKYGGEEVWVVNVNDRKLIQRIPMQTPAFSIELTSGSNPLLIVTNVNMLMDVYDLDGKLQRTLSLGDTATPIALHAQR